MEFPLETMEGKLKIYDAAREKFLRYHLMVPLQVVVQSRLHSRLIVSYTMMDYANLNLFAVDIVLLQKNQKKSMEVTKGG